jgi:methylated-DNA-protein-cysteine methyltransferase-like protein
MDEQFKQQVYEVAKLIPKGRVTTYGAIARALGYPNHSRHVGRAMGGCPNDVPAHRVISSGGTLAVPEFQERLEVEGLVVNNLRIKDFRKLFWNPMDEIID